MMGPGLPRKSRRILGLGLRYVRQVFLHLLLLSFVTIPTIIDTFPTTSIGITFMPLLRLGLRVCSSRI